MKKLKIILPIFLISLLFFVPRETLAATNFVTQQFSTVDNYIQKTGGTVEDFRNFVLDNTYDFRSDLEFENYIILLEYTTNTNRYFNLYYLNADEFNLSTVGTSILRFNAPGSNSKYKYDSYQFNSDYTQITKVSNYNYFYNFGIFGLTGSNNTLNFMILSSNLSSVEYISTSNGIEPITFNSGQEYSFGSDIPLIEFNKNYNLSVIDYYNPVEPLNCSKSQVLGFLSNVSDFTFRIKGKSSALSEPIRGQLRFSYPTDINLTTNDLTIDIIQYNDNEVAGTYNLSCPDNVNTCYIDYSYNYIDDITSDVDFGIQVTFNTNNLPRYIQLNNCFHNDMYDYYNTSYTYTNGPGSSSNNDSVISNFLQDGSEPDLDGLVDTSLIGDGPVDSILLLPLNIMNTLLNVLNSNTCRPLVLPLPFVHQNLTLPCISTIYSQINGLNVFLNWFSAIVSAFILYEYFIRLYKWVDDTLTFRENNHFGGF